DWSVETASARRGVAIGVRPTAGTSPADARGARPRIGWNFGAGHAARASIGVLIMHHACISSSKVTGTAVYNANGDKLGSIDDIMIDKLSGTGRYAALEFGGLFGMGADRYPVPWNVLKYDTRLDGYVVPIRKEQLEKAPRYAKASSPDYDDEY